MGAGKGGASIPATMWTSTVLAAEARRIMALDGRLPAHRAVQKAASTYGFDKRADPEGILLKAMSQVMGERT